MFLVSRREALLKTVVGGALLPASRAFSAKQVPVAQQVRRSLYDNGLVAYWLTGMAPIARRIRLKRLQPGDLQSCTSFMRLLGHHLRNSGYDQAMKALMPLIDPQTVSLSPLYSPTQLATALAPYDSTILPSDMEPVRARTRLRVTQQIRYIQNNGVSGIFLSMADLSDAFASVETELSALGQLASHPHYEGAMWTPESASPGYTDALLDSRSAHPRLLRACTVLDKLKDARRKFCKDHANSDGSYNWQDTPDSDGVTELEQNARTACSTYRQSGGSTGDPESDALVSAACAALTMVGVLDKALLMPVSYGLANVLLEALYQLMGC